jgi:hypothetical protein
MIQNVDSLEASIQERVSKNLSMDQSLVNQATLSIDMLTLSILWAIRAFNSNKEGRNNI